MARRQVGARPGYSPRPGLPLSTGAFPSQVSPFSKAPHAKAQIIRRNAGTVVQLPVVVDDHVVEDRPADAGRLLLGGGPGGQLEPLAPVGGVRGARGPGLLAHVPYSAWGYNAAGQF